jgi:hypothetical protein
MPLNSGGTANLAVLGGNLPPSFGTEQSRTSWRFSVRTNSGGRVPARNGPVARFT